MGKKLRMIWTADGCERPFRGYLLAGLVAIELLMSFSFLGYIHIEPVSLTTAYIPILIAGCLLGPLDATVVGVAFGMASMWKASASYVSAGDAVFSPFSSGQPLASLLLSVGARALFGLLIGLCYLAARHRPRHRMFWIGFVSFFGKTLHSVLVYAGMALLFPELGLGVGSAFHEFFELDNLIAMVGSAALCLICWRIWNIHAFRRYRRRMAASDRAYRPKSSARIFRIAAVTLMTLFAGAVASYVVQRMNVMLRQHDIVLSGEAYVDLMHLQIQFLLGILSLTLLVLLTLIFVQRYAAYHSYEAHLDGLTGVFNRSGFFETMERAMRRLPPAGAAKYYFIILDVDRFKQINDRYGHPEGDRILYEIAARLETTFEGIGSVGRLGGDEFVVFLHLALSRERLDAILFRLMEGFHQIACGESTVSCSAGAVPVAAGESSDEIYRRADAALYQAKENGRDGYWIAGYERVEAEAERA